MELARTHSLRLGSLFACAALSACAVGGRAGRPAASPAVAPAPRPVAIVAGASISAAELADHVKRSGLERQAAREDLIELSLLRRAAAANHLSAPPDLASPEARAQLEYQLARALSLEVPAPEPQVVVDHAWVKDAKAPRDRAVQRKDLERLRALVVEGAMIPVAFAKLGLDGALWHIGDHETYGADLVGPNANQLPAGGLSPIFAGDGGLHLFKIHEHKLRLPDAALVRDVLYGPLRQDKKIELYDEQ